MTRRPAHDTGGSRLTGRDLLAVPTPGHTQGHVVFADVERALLFAGDHVLPRITPSVGFEAAFAKPDMSWLLE